MKSLGDNSRHMQNLTTNQFRSGGTQPWTPDLIRRLIDHMKIERPIFAKSVACARGVVATASLLFLLSTAANSQNRNIAACLSIANTDERIECLEGRAPVQVQPSDVPVLQKQNQSRQSSISPSFDCRAARAPIERAICSDDLLAEWDAKMGKAFQLAMRLRNNSETLQENQRSWIAQRNRVCGSGVEITRSCLLEATKTRLSFLSEIVARDGNDAKTVPVQRAEVAAAPKADAALMVPPKPTEPVAVPSSAPSTSPTSGTQSEGNWSFLSIILLGGGAWVSLKIVNYLQRRRYLIGKYGKEVGLMILAKKMWQGMTEEQLTDSWGRPVEISQEVIRRRIRETWKYGQTGKNRFQNRVYFEDGCVIGWKRA